MHGGFLISLQTGKYHFIVLACLSRENTYWFATDSDESFLICFYFRRERFGRRLPLPIGPLPCLGDVVSLSSVREEQLAVLIQDVQTLQMEVWVTSYDQD
uniref:F-box protein n=1 Tax=Noccaea caerulescens TaxID=107243 RepID=A0A1J3J645_NOCCA